MKKRSQKLGLHRETVIRLEFLTEGKLDQAVGGVITSCTPRCAQEPAPIFGAGGEL